ncbi:MAG TPA: hypothetical protein VMW62_00060 [Chloroflexota bacterium]|nr:hypothetical protein [Chloroflexota bacterium]
MPIQGILTSDAAFSQAKFDQLKQQVDDGAVSRSQALHAQTAATANWFPKPRSEAGPGGDAVWMFTPQSADALYNSLQADGYAAVSLGSAWPPFTYEGHLLNGAFHTLDPIFGGLKADFHA